MINEGGGRGNFFNTDYALLTFEPILYDNRNFVSRDSSVVFYTPK